MVANIFGAIWANRMKLQAQSNISRLQRTLSRITKDISRHKSQLARAKRMETNQIKQKYSIFSDMNIRASLSQNSEFACLFENGVLSSAAAQQNQAAYDMYIQSYNAQKMMGQNCMEQELAQIEEYYEILNEQEVVALEDQQAEIEAEIETEKAHVQMYEGMHKTSQEFAKNNIQNMFQA